ncbi:MAG TPA: metal-dependent hydrolase [Thermoanaerobaculia bacterium]|nr:metal-dependent hydrolase [Thermoanaerobaculia bacterium]
MDPLTHALAGAAVAWSVSGQRLGKRALVLGAVAGLLPDLDVFIRSASDPLLAIEHHRGFTHSFAFVPIGGLLAAFLAGARKAWLAGILAYLTHPLLDASTTYGTQLFWPFLDTRVGLDVISIVDPIFTLILAIACIARWNRAALAIAVLWLALGFVQRERASAAQLQLARQRGDRVERAAVFPTFGNTIVWRSLYKTNGMLRMDRIRVPWFGSAAIAQGSTVPDAMPRHSTNSVRDLERFAWFSDRWLARDPEDPTLLGDARYSLHNDRYKPVWGIRFTPQTRWVDRSRERRVSPRETWDEITGRRFR